MQLIVDYIKQYPLILAGFVVVLLFLCWQSEEVRGWVIRLAIFILVLGALYLGFQKFRYLIPSSQQPPALRDDSLVPEKNAGQKYYRDPEEVLRKSQ